MKRQSINARGVMMAFIAIAIVPWMACVPGGFQLPSICDPPTPTIKSIAPNQVRAGAPSFALQVTGKDFHSATFLTINGVKKTTMVGGEHELSALIDTSDIVQVGVAQITVITPPPKNSCGGGISNTVPLAIAP